METKNAIETQSGTTRKIQSFDGSEFYASMFSLQTGGQDISILFGKPVIAMVSTDAIDGREEVVEHQGHRPVCAVTIPLGVAKDLAVLLNETLRQLEAKLGTITSPMLVAREAQAGGESPESK